MRYAAKRTWPDRPKSWQHQGEAEDLESFALAFATEQGLGVGTEFEVLDKDYDDATLVTFRVTSTIPYTLGPSVMSSDGQTDGAPPPPFMASALSFGMYMVKVAVLALVIIAGLIYLFKLLGLTN